MHEPITGYLEEYLSGTRIPQVEEHLRHCDGCRQELAMMTQHSALLRSLRSPESVEPFPGFYARVMDRVQTQAKPSAWALFGESMFAKRMAIASLTFMLLLSAAFLANPPGEVHAPAFSPEAIIATSPEAIMAAEQEEPMPLGTDQQRDREAILVQLATYSD